MAATSASCLKVTHLEDIGEIHALLREYQQFEVVIGSSEETFRLAGIAASELDDLCEVGFSTLLNSRGIPTKQWSLYCLIYSSHDSVLCIFEPHRVV